MIGSGIPALHTHTDAELLDAHVGGDRYAFAELLGRHHRQLTRLAASRSNSPEDAADALQEALLAAHRAAGTFRHQAAVRSWLHRIVINACIDQGRRSAMARTVRMDAAVAADIAAPVETALVVRRALMALPVEQRAAVMVVDMQGYSVAEAAHLLGVPEGTVKSRRARARARLATALGPLREVPDDTAGH